MTPKQWRLHAEYGHRQPHDDVWGIPLATIIDWHATQHDPRIVRRPDHAHDEFTARRLGLQQVPA